MSRRPSQVYPIARDASGIPTCKHCQGPIVGRHTNARHCSEACYDARRLVLRKAHYEAFERQPIKARECADLDCKTMFIPQANAEQYCSRACRLKAKREQQERSLYRKVLMRHR
jgi:hypothetical protein